MSKQPSVWAKLIGSGLAHAQHGLDYVAEFGFAMLKKAGKTTQEAPKKNENKYLFTAKKAGKGVLAFLGTVGSEFYDKYEELKADESKAKKKS